jgi:integrase
MPRKSAAPAGHTGRTAAGCTRDVKVERIGPVTVYKRGHSYYLYYRQARITERRKIDGNLAVARATAHKIADALAERRPSPLSFARTSPQQLADGYRDYVANVQKLALRTRDRYKAALDRFLDFCRDAGITSADAVDLSRVEDFVKWLRGQKRNRNGSAVGSRDFYKVGGVRFVLSACRTAFNWAARRRMLPPFSENPFSLFRIDRLKEAGETTTAKVFSYEQELAFLAACDDWQRPIFTVLAAYGLRLGELTNLLVEDVDLAQGVIVIRSKPWLFWTVKTGRERELPLIDSLRPVLERAIGGRSAGFVFRNRPFLTGSRQVPDFASPQAFRARAERAVSDLVAQRPDADDRERKRAVIAFGRAAGQTPEKAIRNEFLRLTTAIGCPEFTRVHDLRHLFSTRAQAAGINPILVQEILGHTTLEMTRRYTHLGLDSKRAALQVALERGPNPS